MNPLAIIEKYYEKDSPLYNLLVTHSQLVVDKALKIAKNVPEMKLDLNFIKEAGMLHDIGIFLTKAPSLYCTGTYNYLCHGYLGNDLLVKEGLPKHGLVAERHTGTGLTLEKIKSNNLPLPLRDMAPESSEEKLICLADKFYSKDPEELLIEKSIEKIEQEALVYGEDNLKRLRNLFLLFSIKY
jgi:uncharacterized protein